MVTVEARQTLTVEEAAKVLGIGRRQAYEGCREGRIPHVRVGSRILIPTDVLQRMLADAEAAAAR